MYKGIDLSSDTATRPSSKMREAIASAIVGDEQKGEDPTTLRLQEYAADLLKKEDSLFLPSATMANEIAILLSCSAGDRILAAQNSHILSFEVGGPAALARAASYGFLTPTGLFDVEDLEASRLPSIPHCPVDTLISIENTTNMGGGRPWPIESLTRIREYAKARELRLHMDGARLFNAVAATGVSAEQICQGFDTVTICLSKGLGAPMGAILAGSKNLIDRARRFKHLMGGAMRQSGLMAAAGLHGLQNGISRLAEDHENAEQLALELGDIVGLEVLDHATNMIFFAVDNPQDFLSQVTERGVRFSLVSGSRLRAVTHLDISKEDISKTVQIVKNVLGQ